MARQADNSLQQEFGLPLGLVVIDTIAACAGYTKAGDENDSAAAQAVMKLKTALRKGAARTVTTLMKLIGKLIKTFAPEQCANYFRHAGYA